MKLFSKKTLASTLMLGAVVLTGCGGGGGGGGGGGYTSTYGAYSSPYATATQFVDALNNVDGAPLYDQSEIALYADETYRSQIAGQEEWFVIYDAKYDEYKAVSLQYIRAIVYYDYYANDSAMASEFRNIELGDIANGDLDGDFWGDDYEVVDYDGFTDSYWGRNSGFEYEDEDETTDVNLMMADKEKAKFYQKAANVSYAYNVNIDTAMSLVTLGSKVEKIVKKGEEQMTEEDKKALFDDLTRVTGASMDEVLEAAKDSTKKEVLVEKIAEKLGTSADNLENRLLPDVFGISL